MSSVGSFLQSLFTTRRAVGLFFGLLLLTGLLLHRDYGVSVDEPRHRLNAMVNIKYVGELVAPELVRRQTGTDLIPALKGFSENDHGVAFEVPMALLNRVLTRTNPQAGYWLRHLCIFLGFVGGVYALYGLAKLRFQNWRWGLLAALLLVLSPRLFAEAFYNGQDIVFMALFTISMYTLTRFLRRPTYLHTLLHALATALAIDVRIPGVMLVAFTLGMMGLEVLLRPKIERQLKLQLIKNTALYLLATALFVLIGWPALWEAPLTNFVAIFRSMSHFNWHSKVFYFGQYLSGNQIPWHYIPVWIMITTPLSYLLAAGLGLLAELRAGGRGGLFYFRSFEARLSLLTIVWLLSPVLLVIGLKSVVYNGWRHLYFVCPALLLLSVQGVRFLMNYAGRQPAGAKRWLAYGLLLVGGLEVGHTLVRMVRLHPHQQVYFSFLPASTVVRQFDRDYWGLSYHQGLEWILTHDPSPKITYAGDPWMLYANSLVLSADQKNRLQYIWNANRSEVRYFLTTYHQHNYPHSYPDSVGLGREVHTVRAEGVPILSIYRQQ